ncbi:hypothetical protein FOF46_26505 [Aquimarina algiphila]|uniref:Uncharacterized protein n=1 Tax=Aquimarina algiphila TaxID=2047982 RepID=A0A554VCG7_9FLAO|nr:hypothetical protein FOF46_26505 [Aquimarina algiphila]
MDTIKFEELLEEHLSEVKKAVSTNFKESNIEKIKAQLYFSQNFNMNFYGMLSHVLSLETDESDIVKSITIHFDKVINRQFYDSFIEKYGEPDHIHVISNRKIISEGSIKDDIGNVIQHARKSEGDLIEGTFDEKPLFMIWKKENFYIQAFLRHKQNISEIMFNTESPPFNVKPSK